jgi:GH24 family phage-related lysozyme (muramidase)
VDYIDSALDHLVKFEGLVPWFYCDRKGLVTVGIGHLVKDTDHAERLPMFCRDSGELASDSQKRLSWKVVHDFFRPNAAVGYYSGLTFVRMDPAYAKRLCRQRLTAEFVPALQKTFPRFDRWPDKARIAMLDMVYPLGHAGLLEFKKLCAAAGEEDWRTCAAECHRKNGREDRNTWTANMFSAAASLDP